MWPRRGLLRRRCGTHFCNKSASLAPEPAPQHPIAGNAMLLKTASHSLYKQIRFRQILWDWHHFTTRILQKAEKIQRTNAGPLEINVISGFLLIVTISMSNLSWPYPRPLSRYFTSSGVEKSREDIRFRWSQMDVLSLFSPQASASLLQIYAATKLKMAQFPTYFGVQSCDTAEQRWVTVSGWRMWLTHLCSAQIPASPSYQHKRELCKQSVQFSCI